MEKTKELKKIEGSEKIIVVVQAEEGMSETRFKLLKKMLATQNEDPGVQVLLLPLSVEIVEDPEIIDREEFEAEQTKLDGDLLDLKEQMLELEADQEALETAKEALETKFEELETDRATLKTEKEAFETIKKDFEKEQKKIAAAAKKAAKLNDKE